MGLWSFALWGCSRVPSLPSAAPDFLSALVAYWKADGNLTAISATLHLGVAPAKTPKPFCTITNIGNKTAGRNTGVGYWQVKHYQISVYDTDADRAATAAETIRTEFDILQTNRLTFANGYQMSFYSTDDNIERARNYGSGGVIDFPVMLTYQATIGRARA